MSLIERFFSLRYVAHARRTLRLAFLPFLVLATACGTGQHETPEAKIAPAASAAPFSFEQQLGWLHGPCLAILNSTLSSGTAVTVVLLEEPQRILTTKINAPGSIKTCHALEEGRALMNAKTGASFYTLADGVIAGNDMGVGIIASPVEPQLADGMARVDLDQDGQSEVFTSCSTSEGIRFAAWTGKAYKGEPRWSSYYYINYDATPNCP